MFLKLRLFASAYGHQTQVALVAPTAAKMSWTWRQAATYSPGLLPLTISDQGNQLPFISQLKRRKKGWPQACASAANWRDVGVVGSGDHVGELEVRLGCGTGRRRRGLRAPAQHRDRPVDPRVFHRRRRETVERAWGRLAVGKRRGEADEGEAFADNRFEGGNPAHVPWRRRPGQLIADPGAPVDRFRLGMGPLCDRCGREQAGDDQCAEGKGPGQRPSFVGAGPRRHAELGLTAVPGDAVRGSGIKARRPRGKCRERGRRDGVDQLGG